MIKAIYFGTNTPDNRLNVIQRSGGKQRIVLAITVELDVISERLEDLNSQATASFSITEIPLEVARKVIADTAEGQCAVVVLEHQRQVADHVRDAVAAFVHQCVRQIA